MTTINTIEDLVRILREQPDWAQALRALLLTQELLDLPGRFDRFVETQQETNRLTDRRLNAIERRLDAMDRRFDAVDRRLDAVDRRFDAVDRRLDAVEGRLNTMDGRLGNLEGGQYERDVRNKALARTMITLGFQGAYIALAQDGHTAPNLNSAIAQAVQNGSITADRFAELFETDIIITAEDNRHAVIEVSITAEQNDIDRAKARAAILAAVTGGTVTPVVITSRVNPVQSVQAEGAGVTIFLIPYP